MHCGKTYIRLSAFLPLQQARSALRVQNILSFSYDPNRMDNAWNISQQG
ncbi:hypothetical protein GCHA_0996 [Paraglaciecola chathamensis S18K6]|uniref:Uncharacterized protein n=1 Tax=Paraglaciecola chathamensis S18K6 TaxID=1127672 RepID=A0AAV3UVK9_9ALTE|nr:hypothetical protein GCHA_0996 [Paraglaciecola chathamensis S18K6]